MKLKNERIIENLLIEISHKFKQKERTANSAFAKPGFLSTFERFWFYVTFGFAEAFRLKSPASQSCGTLFRNRPPKGRTHGETTFRPATRAVDTAVRPVGEPLRTTARYTKIHLLHIAYAICIFV